MIAAISGLMCAFFRSAGKFNKAGSNRVKAEEREKKGDGKEEEEEKGSSDEQEEAEEGAEKDAKRQKSSSDEAVSGENKRKERKPEPPAKQPSTIVNVVARRILESLLSGSKDAPASRFIVRITPLLRTCYVEMGELCAAADDVVEIMKEEARAMGASKVRVFFNTRASRAIEAVLNDEGKLVLHFAQS